MRVPMLSLGLVLAPLAAAAQQLDCNNARTQIEMTACAEQAWMDADQALNGIWGQARAVAKALDADLLPPQRGIWQALLDGQRAWITFRDKGCEAEAGIMRGGSAEPMLVYGCRERVTWERVEGLQGFVDSAK